MQIFSRKYGTWPRNIQTLSKKQFDAHPYLEQCLHVIPPLILRFKSFYRETPNVNVYKIAKKTWSKVQEVFFSLVTNQRCKVWTKTIFLFVKTWNGFSLWRYKKCLKVRQALGTWKLWKLENLKTWDMLNNFCFHVYAQKSLFKVENVNGF